MYHGYDEPVFLISIVSKMLDIHPQTLRQYEKEGLIEPNRTDGKMRLYSQRDVDKIKTILKLTRDMGINLAGVDFILKLKSKLDEQDVLLKEFAKSNQAKAGNANVEITRGTSSYEIVLFSKKLD